ncbi:MAG: flavodoxin family protein [Pseudomonadota bacterium]
MKTLVLYSSKTGNTKLIAEAMASVLDDATILPIEQTPSTEDFACYDMVCIGYWVDKGLPDAKCLQVIKSLNGCNVALFGTLGAYPDSDHAKECIQNSEVMLNEENRSNTCYGSFLCQGKVDPRILEMMQKMASAAHPMTEERKARIEEAKKHPNEQDCLNAQAFMQGVAQAFAQKSA